MLSGRNCRDGAPARQVFAFTGDVSTEAADAKKIIRATFQARYKCT
jgi:hypothetical protein